ncbi:hypothetical protein [Sulfuricurvum sp.]|uniref:hypothetical protein n=1 Tax=Sulfuricurvum sp. TaxID=2025608 RepID=UPI00356B35AC
MVRLISSSRNAISRYDANVVISNRKKNSKSELAQTIAFMTERNSINPIVKRRFLNGLADSSSI